MSFGIGIGDILALSGLAYALGRTLTSGRGVPTGPKPVVRHQQRIKALISYPREIGTLVCGLDGDSKGG